MLTIGLISSIANIINLFNKSECLLSDSNILGTKDAAVNKTNQTITAPMELIF